VTKYAKNNEKFYMKKKFAGKVKICIGKIYCLRHPQKKR